MKLENQVCSLELAKKLKELGVKQESLFYYCSALKVDTRLSSVSNTIWLPEGIFYISEIESFDYRKDYSAFTVAELGEMLPYSIAVNNRIQYFYCGRNVSKEWWAGYNPANVEYFYEKTEADARAKMLIYLIENKLISVEEINKNL